MVQTSPYDPNANTKLTVSTSPYAPGANTTLGVQAKAPITSTPTNTIPSNQIKAPSTSPAPSSIQGGVQPDYTLHQGESMDAYYQRTQGQNQSQAKAQTQPTTPPQTTTPPQIAQPSTPTTQQFSPQDQGLYGQLIAALANKSTQPSPDYLQAQQQAQDFNRQLTQSKTEEASQLGANAQNPIPLEFQQGRGQVIQGQYQQQQAGLASGFAGASSLLGAGEVLGAFI
jgi:hypothetical protein